MLADLHDDDEVLMDLASERFCDDLDVMTALDEYVRGRISGPGLIERLEFLRGLAFQAAVDSVDEYEREGRRSAEAECQY